MGKPVIAAINGPAVGLGLSIALAADIRIAAESAALGAPYAKRGLGADGGISWMLPRLVGMGMAAEMLFTGELIGAQEALRVGLINRVVADELLIGVTLDLAAQIAANAPLATKYIKEAIYQAGDCDIQTVLDLEARRIGDAEASEDFREGIQAFLEKRLPVFKGR